MRKCSPDEKAQMGLGVTPQFLPLYLRQHIVKICVCSMPALRQHKTCSASVKELIYCGGMTQTMLQKKARSLTTAHVQHLEWYNYKCYAQLWQAWPMGKLSQCGRQISMLIRGLVVAACQLAM